MILFKEKRPKPVIDMINGPLLSGIVKFAIPVMITGMLQILFNIADMAVLGRFCGNSSYSAVGATAQLTALMVNSFLGLSVGCGVCVAQAVGAKDKDAVEKGVHTSVLTGVFIGAFLTVVGIIFAPTFLRWMDTPETIIDRSILYIRYYSAGAIPMMLYNFCAAILRAVGDAKRPMYYGMLAGILNVCLNLIFVLVFKMDVAGVALATTLSQCLSCFLAVRSLMRREDACRLFLGKLGIHGPTLAKIIKIGLPSGLQSALFSISNVTIQSSVNSFGEAAIAGNAASTSWEQLIWQALNGFFQATVTFTGQNVGARNHKRLRKVAYTSMACSAVVGISMAAVMRLFGEYFLGLYITDSPESIEKGLLRMTIVCLPYFLNAGMNIPTYGLRGMGRSLIPMIVAIFGVCGLRIIWVFTVFQIPQYHTLQSLYFTYPLTWSITSVAQWTMYMLVSRKFIKKMKQQELMQ